MFNDGLDRERMESVKRGDKAALEALYGDYAKTLIAFFYRLTWDRTQSEDLLQETFLRVWKSAQFYRGDSKVSTYIFQIAKNLAFSNQSLARNRHEKTAHDPHQGDDPAARESHYAPDLSIEKQELRQVVRQEVDALPEPQRICVILAQFQELKQADIAQILGIPVGTVKSRLFNAEQTLRRRLGRYLDGAVGSGGASITAGGPSGTGGTGGPSGPVGLGLSGVARAVKAPNDEEHRHG